MPLLGALCWSDEHTIYGLEFEMGQGFTNIHKVIVDTETGNCTWELFDSLPFYSDYMSCQRDGIIYVPENCQYHCTPTIRIYDTYRKIYQLWSPTEINGYSYPQISVNNDFIVITVGDSVTESYIFVYSIDRVFLYKVKTGDWVAGSYVTYGGMYWGISVERAVIHEIWLINLHTKETYIKRKFKASSTVISGTKDGFVFVPNEGMDVYYEDLTFSNDIKIGNSA